VNEQTSTADDRSIDELREALRGKERWSNRTGSGGQATSRPLGVYEEHPDGGRSVTTPWGDDA
jgi:hypothetical protein